MHRKTSIQTNVKIAKIIIGPAGALHAPAVKNADYIIHTVYKYHTLGTHIHLSKEAWYANCIWGSMSGSIPGIPSQGVPGGTVAVAMKNTLS